MASDKHDGEPPGHHWREPQRVQDFVARMDARADQRRAQFELLVRLLPFESDAPIRVLDVGAGYGAAGATGRPVCVCAW
jgi:hypothetical protein